MANPELWEIEVDFKTDKWEAAKKKYDESLNGIKEKEKRLTEAMKNEGKVQTANALTDIKERSKIRMAAIDAELKAERDAAQKLRKQREADSKFTGQSSQIKNFGVTELSGAVGSQAYVNMLKGIRAELNPASQEFTQLSNSIKQYQAELDKVNKSSGLQSFKQLTLAIKETKGELARLAAEQKVGTQEWQKYSDKLRELQRQKQLIQRETKLTSQQLIAMSRDLTVVAYGLQSIGSNIISLTEGKKSAGEMAMAIGGIGIQTLAVLPAIHGLTKALEASGLVSAATIAKLSALSSTIASMGGAIALQAAGFILLVKNIGYTIDVFGRLGSVLNGTVTQAQFANENIRLLTFGLVDLNNSSDNFDSSNVQNQLSDLAYIANFTANAFNDLKQQVDNAVSTNLKNRLMPYYVLTKDPLSFAGPDISDQDRLRAKEEYEKSKKTKRTGTGSKTSKQEKEEELNLIKLQEQEYAKLQKQYDKNLGDLGAQNDLRLKMLDIEREIFRLRYGADITMKNLPDAKGINTDNLPGINLRHGFKLKSANANDGRGDMTSEEIEKLLAKTELSFDDIKNTADNIVTPFQNILEFAGLTETSFGQILSMVQTVLNTGSGIFGAISSLLSFVPGGSIIGGAINTIGGLSGGGIGSTSGGGLQYGGGGLPNYTMPNRSAGGFNGTVIVNSEVEKTKSVKFYQNTFQDYSRRQAVKKL